MSEFSFPFTGNTVGDDGPYSASFYAEMTASLFGQLESNRENVSVLWGSGNGTDDPLEVTETSPASNSIEIKKGRALVRGYYYYNDSDLNLEVSPNTNASGYDRIDIVVLENDFVNNVVRAKIIEGTADAVPVAPTLTKNASFYQVPIAQIDVSNLFTSILNADIDNTVKEQAIVRTPLEGGTGIEGGVQKGDLIIGTGTNIFDLFNYNSINGSRLVVDTAQSEGMKWIDSRPSQVWKASGSATTAYSNPMVLDSSSDVASNFRSPLSGNTFYPKAGIYQFYGEFQAHSASTNLFAPYLHNTTTGTYVYDVGGQYVIGSYGTVPAGGQVVNCIMPRTIVLNGTETLQLRLLGSALYTNQAVTVPPYRAFLRRIG